MRLAFRLWRVTSASAPYSSRSCTIVMPSAGRADPGMSEGRPRSTRPVPSGVMRDLSAGRASGRGDDESRPRVSLLPPISPQRAGELGPLVQVDRPGQKLACEGSSLVPRSYPLRSSEMLIDRRTQMQIPGAKGAWHVPSRCRTAGSPRASQGIIMYPRVLCTGQDRTGLSM